MTSQVARKYQVENGHYMCGEIQHGKETRVFHYGLKTAKTVRTQLIHGVTGSDNGRDIESVDCGQLHTSDVVKLADGGKYLVTDVEARLIDELQLRNLPYEKADKVWRITLRAWGGTNA